MKSQELDLLKTSLISKDTEISILKDIIRSSKSMLQVKDTEISRLKMRQKKQEVDYQEVLLKYQNLQDICQSMMGQVKNKTNLVPLQKANQLPLINIKRGSSQNQKLSIRQSNSTLNKDQDSRRSQHYVVKTHRKQNSQFLDQLSQDQEFEQLIRDQDKLSYQDKSQQEDSQNEQSKVHGQDEKSHNVHQGQYPKKSHEHQEKSHDHHQEKTHEQRQVKTHQRHENTHEQHQEKIHEQHQEETQQHQENTHQHQEKTHEHQEQNHQHQEKTHQHQEKNDQHQEKSHEHHQEETHSYQEETHQHQEKTHHDENHVSKQPHHQLNAPQHQVDLNEEQNRQQIHIEHQHKNLKTAVSHNEDQQIDELPAVEQQL